MSSPHSKRTPTSPVGVEPTGCDTSLLDIAALADGQLSDAGKLRLRAHTAGCEACRRVMQEMVAEDALPDPPPHRPADWTPLLPPDDN